MRAPDFWFRSGDWRANLLRPLAVLYGGIAKMRLMKKGVRAPVPVICIGNFTAGGAGKTPTAIAVAAILRAMGETPVFLTRGYGGSLAGPHRVDPARDDAARVGDEALLLARHAPVVKAVDRVAGAALASGLGSVIVMDDGLQNPSLAKDFSIAVVDAETGIGNGLCIPAGPLRAPLVAQLRVTDAVLAMGAGKAVDGLAPNIAPKIASLTLWHAKLAPDEKIIASLRAKNVFAFAGIGRPDKFFTMLAHEGVNVAARESFGDHQPYTQATLQRIAQTCARENLVPVTTEKDAVRIGAAMLKECHLGTLVVVPVALASADETAIAAALKSAITDRRV